MAQVELNKTEAWRVLDALRGYKQDYELTDYALKTIRNIEKKLKKIVNA
tara:strand:+ start:1436 stop:1582 length:147 start_codon:yes stop_codon:yes gene_type:complete